MNWEVGGDLNTSEHYKLVYHTESFSNKIQGDFFFARVPTLFM